MNTADMKAREDFKARIQEAKDNYEAASKEAHKLSSELDALGQIGNSAQDIYHTEECTMAEAYALAEMRRKMGIEEKHKELIPSLERYSSDFGDIQIVPAGGLVLNNSTFYGGKFV